MPDSPVPVRRSVRLHGHRLVYREAGPPDGPALVLVHGLASDSGTWEPVLEPLARHGLHVVAPDLFGHGASDKPPTDYGLGGFATNLRDLLLMLDLDTVTLGGHSLGAGIAMQVLYQYPERCERLVLVAAGGFGVEVHPVLRLATLPGVRTATAALVNRRTAALIGRAPWLVRGLHLPPEVETNLRRAARGLSTPGGRKAFFAALHTVIGPGGQRISAIDKLYLAEHLPTLLVSAEHDSTIPVAHSRAVHERLPGSELVLLPGRGHEPHRRHPQRFADAVADFVLRTPAPVLDPDHLRSRLRADPISWDDDPAGRDGA